MSGAHCVLALILVLPGQGNSDNGAIRGIVVNASQGNVPIADAEVILRIQLDGQFVPAAETLTDAKGEFQFVDLPVGEGYLYLPGANQDGIHYPGARVRLTAAQSFASVKLEVCDSRQYPNPLMIRRYDIRIQTQPGALRVTESLVVDNPTRTTYVGQPEGEGAEPVTLQLGIPSDFDRTTFHQEFYGRRFSLAGGRLVTSVPWTPGQRELKFTYTLRNAEKYRLWQRPLDLPCQSVRVRIDQNNSEEVSCNLPPASRIHDGQMVFESKGETLPAGHVIRAELGKLPLSWMFYARWLALALLAAAIAVTYVVTILKPRRLARPKVANSGTGRKLASSAKPAQRRSRRVRRQRVSS